MQIDSITGIFSPFGTQKVKQCKWCYSLIYGYEDDKRVFCSQDCRDEHFDWLAVNYYRRNRLYKKEKYASLLPEQKKEYARRTNASKKKRVELLKHKILPK